MRPATISLTLLGCLMLDAVQAHAHLEKSTPADGSTLSAAPAAIELRFSEPARLTALAIQKGQEPRQAITELPPTSDREQRVALPTLAPGVYALTWRALAADGHVSSGVVHFTITAAKH